LKHRLTILLILWALLGALAAPARGEATSREYEVKAAMICNFAQFVEWPKEAFDSESAPVIIEVVGANPFGKVLDQVAASKKVGEREIQVKYVSSPERIGRCHLLFVAAGEESNLNTIMNTIGDAPVLTLGETDAFPWAGGIIRFYTADGKLRFEVNVKAADKAKLKISSKLLKLARIFDKQG
jgi:hypothetical protein